MVMASSCFPSPDPSSSGSCGYDVFLSFRGEDTRKSFVDHLYAALDQRGFYTFKDDERLRAGELISHKLLEAIEQSGSAVIVFSKNYASSPWCLDEPVKIMDCKEKLGLAVYPVFYDVVPSDIRGQRGTFGEGFAKAAERKADKAGIWRKALHGAANLSGYDLRNTADGFESKCIKKVVEWCNSSYSFNTSAIDEGLIGMPSRVRNLMLLLRRDLDDVRVIGIWGMGGAGKTTIADVAFHEVKNQFDGASFIADVRENSKRIDGLQLLQNKILSDILMDKKLKVGSVPDGKRMIKDRLGQKKVLIILDDVDDDEQLRALAGDCKWFGNGSRVLITTRDRHLLEVYGVDKNDIHSVSLLSEDDAILLFNRHAFKKCSPTKQYSELSLHVVRYAAGLPLALTVLGSFLCGRGMAEWNSTLKRLEKIPEGKILEKLLISYDGLNKVEKEIFLDIACFFKGWEKDEVIRILDSCEFDPVIGIDVLVENCLISLSNEKFQMHNLLQEMGRNIGSQNRLWRSKDIHDVLQNNTRTEAIEAIVMSDQLYNYIGLDGDTKAFMSMKKLRLLHLRTHNTDATFVGPGCLPNELQWLSWDGYPHKYLAESFQAQKLVGLEMPSSSIVHLWEGTKLLDKLEFLDLRLSTRLIRTPDFSGIPNLKELKLFYCTSLTEVHPSIGDLRRLVLLNLSYCVNLVAFPSSIQMESLETLNFSRCTKFKRFPELGGNMDRLSMLHLDGTAIESLPSSITNLTNLVSINLMDCQALLELPDTICTLKYLKYMNLFGCRKLGKWLENLGHIESLEELLVGGSGLPVMPSSTGQLKNLRYVSLSGCWQLKLGESMTRIGSYSKVLDLSHLSLLEQLHLSRNSFASLPFIISRLPRLKLLDLTECKQLKALPELPSSIAILKADDCTSLACIESLSAGKHEWLWYVSLKGCESLRITRDQLYDCHEQGNSIITGQQSIGYKLDHLCGGKHYKKLPNLLQSMLQGRAVIHHRLHIRYPEGLVDCAIPKWFGPKVMKGNRFVLKLPPNWPTKITGFAMCFVFRDYRHYGNISLGIISLPEVGPQIPDLDAEFAPGPADRENDVWIGYMSLKMFRLSTESVMPAGWMGAASTQLLLTFSAVSSFDIWIQWCAARVVCMDEVENSGALSSSFFTCSSSSRLQQHDPNFADKTTLPCSKVPGTANGITLVLDTKLLI